MNAGTKRENKFWLQKFLISLAHSFLCIGLGLTLRSYIVKLWQNQKLGEQCSAVFRGAKIGSELVNINIKTRLTGTPGNRSLSLATITSRGSSRQ